MSTFVSKNPSKRASTRFALEWGIGHSLSLLGLTFVVLFLGHHIGVFAEKALETAVGMALIGLGIWRLVDFLGQRSRVHNHAHEAHEDSQDQAHEHFHVHVPGSPDAHHDHSHVAGFVGLLHGAAGSARFLVLIPIVFIGSLGGALSYVLLFSCGVTMAMMAYAMFLGQIFQRSEQRFLRFQGIYQPLTGILSLGLGIYWIASTI